MQTTQSTKTGNPIPSLASGFGPVPTRISNRPPLVVSDETAAAATRQQVVEMLHEFAAKIAIAHRSAAEAFLSQNLYKEALPHIEASVTFAPDDLENLNQLGFVRYIAGDDAGAIKAFTTLLQRNPTSADAIFNLGMVLFGKSEVERAEECFARTCDLRPGDAEAWNNRGVCAHQLGRTPEAITCFRRALASDPNYADARANLQALNVPA